MQFEKVKKKMIQCDVFIENEAVKLLSELKEENTSFGNIRKVLGALPTNDSFGFVVRKARELLEKEIDAITIK
ncbi:hypothetical protein [Candidatus Enterococcus mansonii]|uniref:Uncharacterized protein n=1 Tax=Candidatus Enterococcus mansonii TaxID=1834181 RepID=A0A242CHA1_9ENTE|nr:hypothetical protein [Enterococcus sp. 4G2_DIV0659]OTO09596.1 hypothetical protein A5880_000275 [Enterococcus sp. 4G2_DIV0659]